VEDARAVRAASVALAGAFGLLLLAISGERSLPRPSPRATPVRGAAQLLWGAPLDLNREEAAAFEALSGIGPARAAAIVAGRPFCQVADLDRVAGIGPRTLGRIREQLAVPNPPETCTPGH